MSETVKLKSPDGRLFEADPEQAATLQRDQGYVPAPAEEVETREGERERYQEFGGAGEQIRGLAETFVRNASLGVIDGLDAFEDEDTTRARALETEASSPVLNTVAGLAPSVGAGLGAAALTGGASLPALLASEGLIGGLGGVGAAQDAAFRHDQELSSEAALGSFAGGFLIGGATAGALAGAGRLAGVARNRFVEASGKAARRAEQEAFQAAGVVRPVDGLADAVDDVAKRAEFRQAAKEARPLVAKKLEQELGAMEAAENAARMVTPELGAQVGGDVAAQRAAVRKLIVSARDELTPVGADKRGYMELSMQALDEAETPEQVFAVARAVRSRLDDMAEAADTPELARSLQKRAAAARELEANEAVFGEAAPVASANVQAFDDLADARTQLREQLGQVNYLGTVGTQAAAPVEEALDAYMTRLEGILSSMESDEAKRGLAAIARTRALREADLRKVAGGNQADAFKKAPKAPADPMREMMGDMAGEAAETAVEALIPGAGLVRKAFKYRKHIARLAGGARKQAGDAADKVLGLAKPRDVAGKFLSPAAKRARARQGQEGALMMGRPKLDPRKVKALQEQGDAVAAQMSDDEIDAIRSFTARHGDKVGTPEWESAIKKLTVENPTDAGPLYRGTRMSQERIDALLRKGEWTNTEPTSLSYNKDLSDAFAQGRVERGQKVLLQIEQLDRGANFLSRRVGIGRSGLEREINLATPTKLRVLGSAVDDEGTTIIRLGSRSGEGGNVNLSRGRNFTLGDVARSPMGVVTAAAVGIPLAKRALNFAGVDADPRRAYEKVKGAVQMLQREPERLAEALAAQMGDIPQESPELLEAVAAKAQRAVDFLQQKLPPAFGYSLLYPEGPPPSRTDMLELSLYWSGVTEPEEVLRAIGDGTAMPEEVEAFRAVHQAWFTELQEALQERIVKVNQAGGVAGAWRIAQLEGLLDLPGGLDPAFSDGVAILAQNTVAEQQQERQAASYVPPPKAGERIKDETTGIS